MRSAEVLAYSVGTGAILTGFATLATRGPFAEAYFTYPDALIAGGLALIFYARKFGARGIPLLVMAIGARVLLEHAQEDPLKMALTLGLWSPVLILVLQGAAVYVGWQLAGRPSLRFDKLAVLVGVAFVVFSASRLYPVFGDSLYLYVYFSASVRPASPS